MIPVDAALRAARGQLEAAGIEGAERDVRKLLSGVLQRYLNWSECLSDAESAQFQAYIDRRAAGEPVSRILGMRDFWNGTFQVTPDVLDPRPDTETLVERALDLPFKTVLDLGTGSGCIVISLLFEDRAAHGVATDISAKALSVARANAQANGVADRLTLLQSDWYAGVTGAFDLIVSNPPYIAPEELPGLQPEVREWDPRIALTDGEDGLSAYRAIASGASRHLVPSGRLLVEIGHRQADAVSGIFSGAGLDVNAVHTDLEGRDRVVEARLSGP